MNNFLLITAAIEFLCLTLPAGNAFANPKKNAGPYIATGYMSPSSVVDSDRGLPIDKSGLTHTEASLLYPIDLSSLAIKLIPRLRVMHEKRFFDYDPGSQLNIDTAWTTLAPGLIIVPEWKPKKITSFFIINRLSDGEFKRKPVTEIIGGAEYTWNNSAWLQTYGVSSLRLRGVYRLRKFPNTKTYLAVAYLDAHFKNNLYLSVGIPSHFRIGIYRPEKDDHLFFEIVGNSRNFPFKASDDLFWTDGHSLSTGLGYRFNLSGLLYGLVRTGVLSEELDFISEGGERTAHLSTKSGFWASVGLETWVDK